MTNVLAAWEADQLPAGLLLVIDDVDERREPVRRLIRSLRRLKEPSAPIRLLLISRDGLGSWAEDIAASGAGVPASSASA